MYRKGEVHYQALALPDRVQKPDDQALADAHRLIGQAHMRRVGIGIAEDRHRGVAQVLGAADDAAGNFAAVGDQDSRKAHSRATPKVLGRSCRAWASSANARHRPR